MNREGCDVPACDGEAVCEHLLDDALVIARYCTNHTHYAIERQPEDGDA